MEQVAQLREQFPVWRRSAEEELVNAITHGLGFVLAAAGSLAIMSGVLDSGNTTLIFGCSAYVMTLMAVYAMSTLSHCPTSFRAKLIFRQLDQAFIYLLIVGNYTPFSLAYLHGWFWHTLLAMMWVIAGIGFCAKVFFSHKVHSVPVSSYLALGWMPIIALPALWHYAPSGVFESILAGGVCYMIGTIFLARDDRVRHFHAIWHICVITGSAIHFLAILHYVVRAGA